MPGIKLEKLEKVYGKDTTVIKDLDLDIIDGEFLVLVGPSGCGKSTTLRLIAGLEEVTSGNIYMGTKNVTELPPKDRDIAMVFQNYALYPHMNVFDNMAFGLKLRKFSKADIQSRVQLAADILDLGPLLERKPKEMSGGQRQRVALGRAIVRQPETFLFDEPLSNLDAKLRVQMRAEIKKLHHRLKTTMVYVTHDQVEAMTMGERVVVMKDGIIHQVDSPLNLYSRPDDKFVAGFIGSPSMNFVEVTIGDNNILTAYDGKFKVNAPERFQKSLSTYQNSTLILGIRPEDIYLDKGERTGMFKANLELLEPLGSEVYIYVTVNGNRLVVKENSFNAKVSGELTLFIDENKLHLFDKTSEKRIN